MSGDSSEDDAIELDSMSQAEVKEYFRSRGAEATSVGEYVRVTAQARTKTGFGPIEGDPKTGWAVVEIDWESRQFLVAPLEARL